MKYRNLAAFTLTLMASIPASAQICNDSMVSSHVHGQYIDNKNGTITDVINGLIWQKCSVGQDFIQSTNACTGNPINAGRWQDALVLSNNVQDWHLPNIKELATLVERKCSEPAINVSDFPTVTPGIYWSNTPDMKDINGNEGKFINFSDGSESSEYFDSPKFVRLVRSLKTTSNY